ncbi:DUF397 domain-containing protein [Kitasatospora sp. NPDC101183]|uniref:DUF397 domain-containing protein n=1 Tax=Kitasatospora sp. NPDC101183 TaxID=3364100 RepID=UPI0038260461
MISSDWQKSSFSGNGNDCVEVRTASGAIELRESDESHLTLHTTLATFATLITATKAGAFDHHA